jgi:hypothetical protein
MSARTDFMEILRDRFDLRPTSKYLDEALVMLASYNCCGDVDTIVRLTELSPERVAEIREMMLNGAIWPSREEWFGKDGPEEFTIDLMVAGGRAEKHISSEGIESLSLTPKGELEALKIIHEQP